MDKIIRGIGTSWLKKTSRKTSNFLFIVFLTIYDMIRQAQKLWIEEMSQKHRPFRLMMKEFDIKTESFADD